ncbi:xylulokinase [Poseidonibacter ostreae]|uniref:Carbohydrate kinase FGGY C-terminal domain-containing protein n=1 Tax=Poseidonibacter ostreae TaxID=2654171 RepID=A0A6L4WQV8_9BACT|nr:FGGY-family carbohydrate kinase [Poseidonibacter ostreae]KAB7885618.1 hypothetical protein GBG19_13710 [Poseidonibacter ostreae]KAB7888277.1 hypothetical protein GA417_00400 [Poseidonibacter ostreae]KAB7889161.1 hypothetical protein GBG18_11600 [Poseidonibacter ostreae]
MLVSFICGVASKDLSASLGESLKKPSSEIFLPYLSGERTPHNDANIRGVFMGLNNYSDKASLTQAIMEGVTFALRDNLEALKATGADLNSLIILGGGSKSIYWQKLIATVLNISVDIPKEGDFGAAFGAARLGMIAANNLDASLICKAPIIANRIHPQKEFQNSFEEAYGKYKKLYPAISNI